jgi:Ni/Co efflux regulator RcnB
MPDRKHEANRQFLNEMESQMKIKTVISAILAMSIAASGLAFGQGNDRGRDEQPWRRDHQDRRDNADFRQNRQDNNGDRNERGAGPNHDFRRGDRLPGEYRSRQYVVDDWRGHRLSAPPRGYHWVQTGGDYVLVAIATGVILQLLLNN